MSFKDINQGSDLMVGCIGVGKGSWSVYVLVLGFECVSLT